jgi:hypothetical protein
MAFVSSFARPETIANDVTYSHRVMSADLFYSHPVYTRVKKTLENGGLRKVYLERQLQACTSIPCPDLPRDIVVKEDSVTVIQGLTG